MANKLEVMYEGSFEQIKEYEKTLGFDKNDVQNILDRACTNGEPEIAKFALEKGADFNPPGGNPLRLASYYNHIDIVKHLLERGADPQPDGNVALQYAAGQGNLEIVDILIKAGAHQSIGEPFMWAVKNNKLEVVKYFVKNTDVDIQYDDSRALKVAQKNGGKEVADYLESVEAHLNTIVGEVVDSRSTRERLLPLLRKASTENDVQLATRLIKDTVDIRMDDDIALRVAAERGNNEVMKLFIEHGADVHALTDAAICGASKNGHLDCVKTLVNHGADIRALSSFPLLIAAHRGHNHIVSYFIDDLNMEVSKGAMGKMKQMGCHTALEIIRQHEVKKSEEVTAANLTYEKAEKLSDQQLNEVIWDWYKDVHGIRPRDLNREAMLNFVKRELQESSSENYVATFENNKKQAIEDAIRWANSEKGQYGTKWMLANLPDYLAEKWNVKADYAQQALQQWFEGDAQRVAVRGPVNVQEHFNHGIAHNILAEPGTKDSFLLYGRETGKQVSPELKIGIAEYTHRYIAYRDGKPVSAIVVALKNESVGLKENTITTAYTDPEYQQRGIATALLKQIQKDFKNKLIVSPDLTEQGVKLFKPKQALTR
ncbi:GNAT family N-acetyltransferase [Burkholderia contaminans]|uniref:GNAT family N-acetyltransferase n=1 Tax=Burkholderia contaminans TaxID=488447 RepID=UPI00158F2561|nr:GNAT family N-acetyltransferase [Burkholderia contaminans]